MTEEESLISNLYFVRHFLLKAIKSFQIRMIRCDLLILNYTYKWRHDSQVYKYELLGIVDRGKVDSKISSDFEIIIYTRYSIIK